MGKVNEKWKINETIDGQIKSIIQMKTLDKSLEYAQMFDALGNTPIEFQQKLIGALNSIGDTKKINPVDVFNVVLCGNQEDDARKKLYIWWMNFFGILSKCDIPKESKKEYDEKIDALIAEITKSGSSVELDGGVFGESLLGKYNENDEQPLTDTKYVDLLNDALKYMPASAYIDEYDGLCIDVDVYAELEINSNNVSDVIGNIIEKYGFAIDEENEWERGVITFTLYRPNVKESNEYEQASKEDEDKMLKDMKFAISKIGEIANRVQDIINFVNPYCKKFNEEYDISKSVSESGEKTLYELGNEEVEVTYYIPDHIREHGEDPWFSDTLKLKEISYGYMGHFEVVNVDVDGETIRVFRTSSPGDYDYFKFDNPEDEEKFLEYSDILDKERRRKFDDVFDAISER